MIIIKLKMGVRINILRVNRRSRVKMLGIKKFLIMMKMMLILMEFHLLAEHYGKKMIKVIIMFSKIKIFHNFSLIL